MPTVAVSGRPLRSGVISAVVVAIDVVAVLFAVLVSLVAPVVPVRVLVPLAVGVPDTVQVIEVFGATLIGCGPGAHDTVRPAGRPPTAHVAAVAVISGDGPLVQLNVPLYGTPTLAVVGKPARLMLISAPPVLIVANAVLLPPLVTPPLVSLIAPVLTVTVDAPAAAAVGVPLTGQVMLAPAATVAGGDGAQVPKVTPAGKPPMAQYVFGALAVAAALFVHLIVPE